MEAVKKTIESEGYEIIGEPVETDTAGIQSLTFSVKKDTTAGAVVIMTYADEESAKQTMAAHEINDQISAERKGQKVVTVTFAGQKEAGEALLKAIMK